jgi:TolB-like protein
LLTIWRRPGYKPVRAIWTPLRRRAAPVSAETAAARLSIVVLPFANLSGDRAQDCLAEALTDELTTDLARIRNSFVIARNVSGDRTVGRPSF